MMRHQITFTILFLISVYSAITFAQTNFWEPLNGPRGGDVCDLVQHPNGELYAGANPGVFKSTDQGRTWKASGLIDHNINTLTIDSRGTIIAGDWGDGIYYSTDNGLSWTEATGTYSYCYVTDLITSPSGKLYAAVYDNGFYTSTDAGRSWQLTGAVYDRITCIAVNQNEELFIGTDMGGILYSTDRGVTWNKTSMHEEIIHSIAIDKNGFLFASTEQMGLWRSSDNGLNWSFLGYPTSDVNTILVDDSGTVYAGTDGDGIIYSKDHGDTWNNFGVSKQSVETIIKIPNGDFLAGVLNDGIFYLPKNSSSWTQSMLTNTIIPELVLSPNNDLYAIGQYVNYIYKSTNYGSSWTTPRNGLPYEWGYDKIAVNSKGHIFLLHNAYGLFYSINKGDDWINLPKCRNFNVTNDLIASDDDVVFIATLNSVMRYSCELDSLVYIKVINDQVLTLLRNKKGNIYAGTRNNGIYKSINSGVDWTLANQGLKHLTIYKLALSSNDRIFAVTDSAFYWSRDDGETWNVISSRTWFEEITVVIINVDGRIFISAENKVYVSSDDGKSWIEKSNGLSEYNISSLVFDEQGFIYAGTLGGGIYRSVRSTLSVQERIKNNRPSFILNQNHPNPYSMSTSISFSLPKPTYITLKIFNTLGQEIHYLIDNEFYNEGMHSIQFEPRTSSLVLHPGVYFYQIITSDYIETKKMIIIQ